MQRMKDTMYIEHTPHHTTDRAIACVRSSVGSLMVGSLVACTLLGAMPAAHAGPGDHEEHAQRKEDAHAQREAVRAEHAQPQGQPGQPQQGGPAARPAEAPRQFDPRSFDGRAEEQRRAMQDVNRNAEAGRRLRMTADERRDLRRQINEAGQDIYANPPRR